MLATDAICRCWPAGSTVRVSSAPHLAAGGPRPIARSRVCARWYLQTAPIHPALKCNVTQAKLQSRQGKPLYGCPSNMAAIEVPPKQRYRTSQQASAQASTLHGMLRAQEGLLLCTCSPVVSWSSTLLHPQTTSSHPGHQPCLVRASPHGRHLSGADWCWTCH